MDKSASKNPSSVSKKITIELLHWEFPEDSGTSVLSFDVSHWNDEQLDRFWAFVHEN